MMEGIIQDRSINRVRAESAGVKKNIAQEANSPSEEAVICMSDRGIDISDHRSRWVGNVDLSRFDIIITVGPEEKQVVENMIKDEPEVIILNEEKGGISDPHNQGMNSYQKKAEMIERGVVRILRERGLLL
jgi:protein-tyrosine-phosphatase